MASIDQNVSFVRRYRKPLGAIPYISRGNEAMDDGRLLLTLQEKKELTSSSPAVKKYIRPYFDFDNVATPYCLWLAGSWRAELEEIPTVPERLEQIRDYRKSMRAKFIQSRANFPQLFGVIRQPSRNYIALPAYPDLTHQRRFPVRLLSSWAIAGESVMTVEYRDLSLYALMNSRLYLEWMKLLLGSFTERRKHISVTIAYNSFPYVALYGENRKKLEELGKQLARKQEKWDIDISDRETQYSCVPEIYMEIDRTVEWIYGGRLLQGPRERIEILKQLYRSSVEA